MKRRLHARNNWSQKRDRPRSAAVLVDVRAAARALSADDATVAYRLLAAVAVVRAAAGANAAIDAVSAHLTERPVARGAAGERFEAETLSLARASTNCRLPFACGRPVGHHLAAILAAPKENGVLTRAADPPSSMEAA